MIAYFAEPIDQDVPVVGEAEFRDMLVDNMQRMGLTVYRPATAWRIADGPTLPRLARDIEAVNRVALEKASVVVARLPRGVVSYGVPMEIENATRGLGIPAVVVGEGGVALDANELVTVVNRPDFKSINEAIGHAVLTHSRPEARAELRHVGPLRPRSYQTDAGIDLVTSVETTIKAGSHGFVPTGTKIEVPPGTFLWITSRSSTYRNFGLQVVPGIIDEGYTGELLASVINSTDQDVTVKVGDRVCQVIVMPNETAKYTMVEVGAIRAGDRGDNGFGSTGKTHKLEAVS